MALQITVQQLQAGLTTVLTDADMLAKLAGLTQVDNYIVQAEALVSQTWLLTLITSVINAVLAQVPENPTPGPTPSGAVPNPLVLDPVVIKNAFLHALGQK